MKYLQDIGWYGLSRLQVWEVDEMGNLLAILRLRKDQKKLLIETYKANPSLPIPNPASPILLALRLEQKLETKIPIEAPHPLAEVLGVSNVDEKQFVWQQVKINDKEQWLSLIRNDQLEPVWKQFEPYRSQIVSLSFSEQTTFLLGDLSQQKALADALDLPQSALFAYGAALRYCQTRAQDLHGLEDILAPSKGFIQTAKRVRSLSLIAGLALSLLLCLWTGNQIMEDRLAERQQFIQQQAPLLAEADSLSALFEERSQRRHIPDSRSSFWLDRTSRAAPPGMQFDRWQYRPSAKQCKKLGLDPENLPLLWIEGNCERTALLNQLAQQIQAEVPGHHISIEQSHYDFDQQHYHFSLIIQ